MVSHGTCNSVKTSSAHEVSCFSITKKIILKRKKEEERSQVRLQSLHSAKLFRNVTRKSHHILPSSFMERHLEVGSQKFRKKGGVWGSGILTCMILMKRFQNFNLTRW